MHKYLTEFIGTFFLSLTAILATTGNYSAMAPLAVGAILIGLTGIGWEISGAHYNPVVSLALLIRGKMERTDFLYYILAQVFGAILAGTIAVFLTESSLSSIPEIDPRQNALLPAIIAEFLGTFAWTMVVVHAVLNKSNATRSSIMLGMVVLALGIAFRDMSGAIFNPAVAVAYMIAGMAFWNDLLLYLIGPMLGAGAAASVFYLMDKAREEEI
ncbi:MAG: aquaporin [Saprospiraceae bacterium]|nr:aquaporin [Saprospiraceae bacterium]